VGKVRTKQNGVHPSVADGRSFPLLVDRCGPGRVDSATTDKPAACQWLREGVLSIEMREGEGRDFVNMTTYDETVTWFDRSWVAARARITVARVMLVGID
jgi:hypothetical protein